MRKNSTPSPKQTASAPSSSVPGVATPYPPRTILLPGEACRAVSTILCTLGNSQVMKEMPRTSYAPVRTSFSNSSIVGWSRTTDGVSRFRAMKWIEGVVLSPSGTNGS